MAAISIPIGAGNYNGGPLNFLVCDDERHIVRLIQVNLERQGHTVVCAFDRQQAIDALQLRIDAGAKMFDKVFLDLMMPKVDGLEVLKWIRTHPQTENVWVAMKIAKGQDRDLFDVAPYRADVYIVPPFNPMDFIR